jgi:hypothetical protein
MHNDHKNVNDKWSLVTNLLTAKSLEVVQVICTRTTIYEIMIEAFHGAVQKINGGMGDKPSRTLH